MEPGYWLARVLGYPLRLAFRIRRVGSENVARRGPVLLACNHVSFLDPLMVLWLGECTRRKIRFLAMAELWRHRFLRFFLVHTKQIPVARESLGAIDSLSRATQALRAGECVCIFPEGGISENLEPKPAKTGVARLAGATGVPVTPVAVWGTHRLYTKGRKPRWRIGVGVTIVVGEPVSIERDDDIFDATDRVMAAVAECVATARRMYTQRPKRGDDGWWVRGPDTAVPPFTSRERTHGRWS
jgi:1-acyl-sn-glycerol-3-phosphate acyltransferase